MENKKEPLDYLRAMRVLRKLARQYSILQDVDCMSLERNKRIIDKVVNHFKDRCNDESKMDYEEVKLFAVFMDFADFVYRSGNTAIISDIEYDNLEQLGLRNNITEMAHSESVMDFSKKFNGIRDLMQDIDVNVSPIIDLTAKKIMTNTIDEYHDYTALAGTIAKAKSIRHTNNLVNSVEKFFDNVGIDNKSTFHVVVSYKYDGNSCVGTFENGRCIKAVSRGVDGRGKDYTNYLKHLYVPQIVQKTGVQFEIILESKNLDELNKRRNASYKNCRSALQAILGDLEGYKDSDLLTFIPLKMSDPFSDRFSEIRVLAAMFGKGMESFFLTGTKDYILTTLSTLAVHTTQMRSTLGFMIDGLVIEYLGYTNEYDELVDMRMKLGRDMSRRINNWEIAYKFDSEVLPSKLLDVTFTVGRTGKITPMAHFEDINFSNGNVYNKASLGSIARCKSLELMIGENVEVQYSNDVIPYVAKRQALQYGDIERREIEYPTVCPVCGQHLKEVNEELKCTNPSCQAKTVLAIPRALKLLGAKNISDKTIELLVNEGIISKFEDMFTIEEKKSEMCNIKGIGEKKAQLIIDEVEGIKHQKIAPSKLLATLGVDSAGVRVFDKILTEMSHYELIAKIEFLWDSFFELITRYDGNLNSDMNFRRFIKNNYIAIGISDEDKIIIEKILNAYGLESIMINIFGISTQLMRFMTKYDLLSKYMDAANVAKYSSSYAEQCKALKSDLEKIPGIGETKALDIISYITPDKIMQYQTTLGYVDVLVEECKSTKTGPRFSVCLTGFRDKDGSIGRILAKFDAVITDNVTQETDLCIALDGALTSKVRRAENMNIPIINKSDIYKMPDDYILEMLQVGNANDIIS